MRFHILADGNPARCESEACPTEPHFLTGVDARKAYEASMASALFPRLTREGRVVVMPDGEVVKLEPVTRATASGDAPSKPYDELRDSFDAFLGSDARYRPYDQLPEEFKPF